MYCSRKTNGLVVLVTTLSLLGSQVLILAAPPQPAKSVAESRSTVVDVKLGADGSLSGSIVDAKNRPRSATVVTLRQGRRVVARASTDGKGHFAITGLRGGLYQLRVDGTQLTCRAWASQTAPRSAVASTRIVADPPVLRGQDGPVVRGQNGLFDDPVISSGVTTALIVGGIVGAMFLIAELDENDDAVAPASP